MRLMIVLLASCVGAVGFAAGPAHAVDHFYGSLLGAYDIPSAKGFNAAFSNTVGNTTTSNFTASHFTDHYSKPENGFMVAVALGYDLSDWVTPGLRVELEGAYRHNNAKGYLSAGFTTSHTT